MRRATLTRPSRVWLTLALVAAVAFSGGCEPRRGDRHPADDATARVGSGSAGPWWIIDEDARLHIGEGRILHQAPDLSPPKILVRRPVALPPGVEAEGPELIVRAEIDDLGRIARVQLLRGPQQPGVEEAVVEALRGWQLAPATLEGEPVAVYLNLLLPVDRRGPLR